MRISGGFLVAALLAAGFTLYLTGRDTSSTFDAVATVADELREQDVTGQSLDRETATRMATVMDGLLDFPDTIGDHVDDLRVMAETAASWAACWPASPGTRAAISTAPTACKSVRSGCIARPATAASRAGPSASRATRST